MDETFLPWWLVLLIGLWIVSLTVWRRPSVHREVRVWAGVLILVYLGLVFLALGRIPSLESTAPDVPAVSATTKLVFMVGTGLSLCAGVWSLGRVSESSRRFSYVVFTVSNAMSVFRMQSTEASIGLLIVAALSAWPLIGRGHHWSIGHWQNCWSQGIRFHERPITPDQRGLSGLIGVLGALTACLLLGTIAFTMRYETTRSAGNTRMSALPTAISLERQKILTAERHDTGKTLFGSRAEVVVLLAVIVFLCLAISSNGDADHLTLAEEPSDDHDGNPVSPQTASPQTAKGLV